VNEKVKGLLVKNGEAMQRAWNELVEALNAEGDEGADAVLYLNGVGYKAGRTTVGLVVAEGLLTAGWNRSTDGLVVRTSPVRPDATGISETFDPALREFRQRTIAELFDKFLAVKLAAGAPNERLRLEVRGGFAPWQIAGAFPDGDALRAGYFDAETLANRDAVAAEGAEMPLVEIEK
jgi:hypothetical protein